MILSGREIEKEIGSKIVIDPYSPRQLNPNSYNLRLNDVLLCYTEFPLDMHRAPVTEELRIPAEGLVLEPHRLYLGSTIEYTETHGYVPLLEGRSSIGRLGMVVHITAGFGDVGFCGHWTLEMYTIHPLRVYSGVEVCQICYHTIDSNARTYQGSKYQHNRGVQASKLHTEFV